MFQTRIRPPPRPAAVHPTVLGSALEHASLRQREAVGVDPVAGNSATAGTLAGFEPARRFFANCFIDIDPTRETLFVAYLDRTAHCIHVSRHDGDTGDVAWPLRAILLEAAGRDAAGLIVAHNHPSGDSAPSASDRDATRRLAASADAINLTLVDHLVFAGEECVSFRRMGLL